MSILVIAGSDSIAGAGMGIGSMAACEPGRPVEQNKAAGGVRG